MQEKMGPTALDLLLHGANVATFKMHRDHICIETFYQPDTGQKD